MGEANVELAIVPTQRVRGHQFTSIAPTGGLRRHPEWGDLRLDIKAGICCEGPECRIELYHGVDFVERRMRA